MRVLFFGRLRDVAGANEIAVTHPCNTLEDLRSVLAQANPALGEALAAPGILVAVDQTIRRELASIAGAAEIAFMPPLSGG